jgi:hypothetical protein
MYSNWKERSKIAFVCRWSDLAYRNINNSTKKLLELKHQFREIAGYKINIKNQ